MNPSSTSAAPLWRWFYTQNPFYLIGTLLILFGLHQCLGSDERVATSGLLPGLLAAYALLLAGIAMLVIRYGQLWDDGRTILLVIVLLFFMLSASLDFVLVESVVTGTLLATAALAFTVLLSEGLLRGLRIHLAPRYRRPYYLMLALLFLYPVVPAWLGEQGFDVARPWAMLAFPPLMGLALLTLIPAAQTRRRKEPASGTPWPWPYYPWSLYVFLTIGAALRAWWLTISFEPLPGTESYFRPYFLLPLFLAWSALLIEMGRARHSLAATTYGMLLPLAGVACCIGKPGDTLIEAAFLGRATALFGSPLQIAVWASLLFYLWAWERKVRAAEGFLMVLGLASSVLGRDTFSLSSLTQPQPLPIACVAGALLLLAVQKHSSWRVIAGGGLALASVRYAGIGVLDEASLRFWQWHAPLLGLMTLGTCFRDELAQGLRELSWRIAPLLAIVAAVVYPWAMPGATPAVLASYLGLLLLVSISLWQRQKELGPLVSALATGGANLLIYVGLLYVLLQQSLLAKGLPYLAGGLVFVVAALAISLLKMGAWQHLRTSLERLNLALGGVPVSQGLP